MRSILSFLLLASTMTACGYGVRGAIGPSWAVDAGLGSTAQVVAPLPTLNLGGVHQALLIGLWGRLAPDQSRVGLSIGGEIGTHAGAIGNDSKDRSPNVGWSPRLVGDFRVGTAGLETTAGLQLLRGRGEAGKRHTLTLAESSKGNFDLGSWYERTYISHGALLQVNTRGFDRAGDDQVTLDLLMVSEWLRVW